MKFDPQKHHRHSIRLQEYDYAQSGAYFVTAITHQRDLLFGKIVDGEMKLNRIGEIVREEWFVSANIRKEIRLHPEEFVIMPNHIHGIVWIENDDDNVGANLINADRINNNAHVGANGRSPLHHPQMKPRSLGSFVAGFKSSVTKRIRDELNETGIWQRNYYEHIVRDEKELDAIVVTSKPIH